MDITSKVRCIYVWEYSVPLIVQAFILLIVATLKPVGVACSDELVSGSSSSSSGYFAFAKQLALM